MQEDYRIHPHPLFLLCTSGLDTGPVWVVSYRVGLLGLVRYWELVNAVYNVPYFLLFSHRVAWGAVKKVYEKGVGGEWVKR